ncbi:transposase [Puteibacter caeruleilacunae]|nr:transposase [Puteibacter caeruleilacunae]
MFGLNSSLRFQLYSRPTDMRKSFDGLSGLVQNHLKQSPTNGDVFVFINKPRNRMKLLHWAGSGFVLYYMRLEQGTFESLEYDKESDSFQLSYSQMVMLIEGISMKNIRRKKRYSLK